MKSIKVTLETWKQLRVLSTETELSMNDVIKVLLESYNEKIQ